MTYSNETNGNYSLKTRNYDHSGKRIFAAAAFLALSTPCLETIAANTPAPIVQNETEQNRPSETKWRLNYMGKIWTRYSDGMWKYVIPESIKQDGKKIPEQEFLLGNDTQIIRLKKTRGVKPYIVNLPEEMPPVSAGQPEPLPPVPRSLPEQTKPETIDDKIPTEIRAESISDTDGKKSYVLYAQKGGQRYYFHYKRDSIIVIGTDVEQDDLERKGDRLGQVDSNGKIVFDKSIFEHLTLSEGNTNEIPFNYKKAIPCVLPRETAPEPAEPTVPVEPVALKPSDSRYGGAVRADGIIAKKPSGGLEGIVTKENGNVITWGSARGYGNEDLASGRAAAGMRKGKLGFYLAGESDGEQSQGVLGAEAIGQKFYGVLNGHIGDLTGADLRLCGDLLNKEFTQTRLGAGLGGRLFSFERDGEEISGGAGEAFVYFTGPAGKIHLGVEYGPEGFERLTGGAFVANIGITIPIGKGAKDASNSLVQRPVYIQPLIGDKDEEETETVVEPPAADTGGNGGSDDGSKDDGGRDNRSGGDVVVPTVPETPQDNQSGGRDDRTGGDIVVSETTTQSR